ncbi:ribosomal-processing cysteine protease Prp [Treponema sp.]|uniref:ribosomal-processing cysteine protease Prp n=1 Tax=Treponema sp. TaxID=166 RepID=UPI00298E2CA6|nr:ribosomal-processing cysteine protease Prp [Treponema sp.]MCR5613076.1 ribosomal-processing cysteine protease Prp [Treponema sp.]
MTEVLLVKAKNGNFLKCNASGHAGFAPKGKDIVCSAVTILMRTAMQVLSETGGIKLETDTSLRGFLSFCAVIDSGNADQSRINTIGDFLETGFKSLSEEFPNNLTFELKLED